MTSLKRWAIGPKPHLYFCGGLWFCKLGIYSQPGATPTEAYLNRVNLK